MESLYEIIDIKELMEDRFILHSNHPVSRKSKFGDECWDFTDENNKRISTIVDSKLKINWLEWIDKLPPLILEDTKALAFFFFKCPSILTTKVKTSSKGYKPNTVTAYISNFLRFIHQLCLNLTITLPEHSQTTLLNSFSDITLSDIEEHARKHIYPKEVINNIKYCLKGLSRPIVQKYIKGNIQWNVYDIKNLHFPTKEADTVKANFASKPLPDDYFQLLSKNATLDIIAFLKQINIPVESKIPNNYKNKLKCFFNKKSLKIMFEQYIYIREKEREYCIKFNKRTSHTSEMKNQFYKEHGIKIKDFQEMLTRVHKAALFLLIQFTGVRYSEAATFKVGCLKEITADMYVIRGTVIKNQASNLPEDIDEWVACSIVRDAVKVLEQISRFTFNKYLMSNNFSAVLNVREAPYSNTSINNLLSSYAAEVDVEEQFSYLHKDSNGKARRIVNKENVITVHRLRHTLALNLIRAKLGIPYISYHLKHVHTALVAREKINNVTLGYGGISNELFSEPSAIKQAREEQVEELYYPDSPVAGGINKEEYKARKKEFFQGTIVDEDEFNEIVADLKRNGAPFADVGLGYCGGKRDIILKNGTKKSPPCIGQLKCNPIQCGNAIIPKSKISIWKRVYKENKEKLLDPHFQYVRTEIQQFVNESKEVLENLGVKVSEL
ncbi:tyrosine-type recombinase/integrase [Priestia megaterium]|uniref:tyrosine-type recombinase/integrase n=1 Tax=Priestia megaterium TaxID=1404 RepID=UPI000C9BFF34|nr:tyrosine-type recombinase/integrase [Priestia megaterium]PNE08459.1 hypothetical protein C1Y47_06645 [Priestia megaterium]